MVKILGFYPKNEGSSPSSSINKELQKISKIYTYPNLINFILLPITILAGK